MEIRSQSSMMNIITHNPYRVLDVLSDDTTIKIRSQATRMKRFLEVGKEIVSSVVAANLLPLSRSAEMVEYALSELSLPKNKVMYACFWYNNTKSGELINRSVDYYIDGEILSAINSFGDFLSAPNEVSEFIRLIDDTYYINVSELKEMYIQVLLEELTTDKYHFILNSKIADEKLRSLVINKMVSSPVAYVENLIEKSKNIKVEDEYSLLENAQSLWDDSQSYLQQVESLIGRSETQYQLLLDNVVKQVLQLCINSVNSAQDNIVQNNGETYKNILLKASKLTEEISLSPVSNFLLQRIETNKKVIIELSNNVESRVADAIVSNEHYCWYCGQIKDEMGESYPLTMYKETRRTYFPQRQVWFKSMPVPIHRCKDCQEIHEHMSDGCGVVLACSMIPNVILLIYLINSEHSWAWIIPGILFSLLITWVYSDVKSKRKCKAAGIRGVLEYNDHPIVKHLIKDGWKDDKPSA